MDYIKLLNEDSKGVFKTLSVRNKLIRVFKIKQWIDVIKVNPNNVLDEIGLIVESWDVIKHNHVSHIATLCNYNNSIIDIYNKYWMLSVGERKARTKLSYCLYYGNDEGIKRYNNYKQSDTTIKTSYIKKYGEEDGYKKYNEYRQKLSVSQTNRYRNTDTYTKKLYSVRCQEYWINKGYTKKESKQIISERQSDISKQFHSTKDNDYYRQNNPMCSEYWIKRGYSGLESDIMIQPYLDDFIQTRDNYIKKYGNNEGMVKWDKMIKKRSQSMLSYLKSECGMYGKASKESLTYFIPLYKNLRINYNIERTDIYFGISGSSEWFIGHGKSYYYKYDFTIRSKKIIIEYNNIRWHPHPNKMTKDEWGKWKIHGMIAQDKYDYDCIKNQTAKNRGYKLLVIWNTDNKDINDNKIGDFIDEHI